MNNEHVPVNKTPLLVCERCKKPTLHVFVGTQPVTFENSYGKYAGLGQMFECECLKKRQFGVVECELVERQPPGHRLS